MTVRTRMAPSPTGEMHVGSMATLLKNYAFAKKHNGQFILRIEDTDQEREVEGAVSRILAVIKAYGLCWDEGPDIGGPFEPYTQSERLPLYQTYADQLIAEEKAYYCFCSRERLEQLREGQIAAKQQPRYDGHCRTLSLEEARRRKAAGETAVIRLKVPADQQITFTDLIRGEITVNSNDIDDQVLIKSDGFPTYHMGVVIDDNAMQITHIMRGEEWISSTPKHVLLYEAFGWEKPVFAHIPVFLNPDGKGKMSKRKGAVGAQLFLDQGYLPEALLNFFMILGWSPKDGRELLTLEEYVNEFDPSQISPKSVVFDLKKLGWLNGLYIRKLDDDQLFNRLQPFIPLGRDHGAMRKLLPLVKERLVTLADFGPLTEYFFNDIALNRDQLIAHQATDELVKVQLAVTAAALQNCTWEVPALEAALRDLQQQRGWKSKQFFMMIRTAVTGQTATPPLFDTLACLGKVLTQQRLSHAAALLK